MTDSGRRDVAVALTVLVVLGLAVSAWLLVVPTASVEGTSCGVPLVNADLDDSSAAADCIDRNRVRWSQAIYTAVGVGLVAGARAVLSRPRVRGAVEAERAANWFDDA